MGFQIGDLVGVQVGQLWFRFPAPADLTPAFPLVDVDHTLFPENVDVGPANFAKLPRPDPGVPGQDLDDKHDARLGTDGRDPALNRLKWMAAACSVGCR